MYAALLFIAGIEDGKHILSVGRPSALHRITVITRLDREVGGINVCNRPFRLGESRHVVLVKTRDFRKMMVARIVNGNQRECTE